MSVYGDTLAFFPELYRPITFFTMKPNLVAGYENRAGETHVNVIHMPMKPKDIGYEGGTLSYKMVKTVWTEVKLRNDTFARVGEEDYRCVNVANPWGYEGNFNIYVLESLRGNTDKQEQNENVDLGKSDYD